MNLGKKTTWLIHLDSLESLGARKYKGCDFILPTLSEILEGQMYSLTRQIEINFAYNQSKRKQKLIIK